MEGEDGKDFKALTHARKVKVGKVGQWSVKLMDAQGSAIEGRVVVAKLPAPLAAQAQRRTLKRSQKRCKSPDKRSLEAAHYVMLFTTLPEELLGKAEVMKLYRYRWQIELAFKRLKQLLKFGHLPHQDGDAARGWIHAKLLVAMLLETLFRNARTFSPWGYEIPLPSRIKTAA
jgi:IS4 transposase